MNEGAATDADYLVKTKLSPDYLSFETLLKEAFKTERGFRHKNQIAACIGVTPAQITHWIRNTHKMSPESMRKILEKVNHPVFREQLVRAWLSNSLEEDFIGRRGPHTVTMDESDAACLKRIRLQVLQGRLLGAESIAYRRLERTRPGPMYERLLDQLLVIRSKLDEPGRAMEVARVIAEGAAERNEPARLAVGHLARTRILSQLSEVSPKQVLAMLHKAHQLVARLTVPSKRPPYVLADQTSVFLTRVGVIVSYMESRRISVDYAVLDSLSQEIQGLLAQGVPQALRSLLLQQTARILLLKGETFQATETLDAAYAAADSKLDTEPEYCAFIAGKIMHKTDGPEPAARYLRSVSKHYRSMGDIARMRLVNAELALAESDLFP